MPFSPIALLNPFTLFSLILILRHRSTASRVHAAFLLLLFIPIQLYTVAHDNPHANSELHHRQLVSATAGAFVYIVAVGITALIVYFFVGVFGTIFAFAVIFADQYLPPRLRSLASHLGSVLTPPGLYTYTTSSFTSTIQTGTSFQRTTVTNVEQPQSTESSPSDHSPALANIISKTTVFLAPIFCFFPTELVSSVTPFLMSPSTSLLVMASSSHPVNATSGFDIIRLATAGAVGLWYTQILVPSMLYGNVSTGSDAVTAMLSSIWWFCIGVASQVYVTANIVQLDLYNQGVSAFRTAWLVLLFRLALRCATSAQRQIPQHHANKRLLLEPVKGSFVIYLIVLCARLLEDLLRQEQSASATG